MVQCDDNTAMTLFVICSPSSYAVLPDEPHYLAQIELIQEKLLAFKYDRKRLRRLTELRSQLSACLSSLSDREEMETVQQEVEQVRHLIQT